MASSSVSGLERQFLKLQFTGKMRLRLYRKLARFLGNDVNLTTALDTMWNHASNDGKKPKNVQAVVIDAWRRNVEEGKNFGVAIQDWVPQNDRVVIEAGEKAGNLSDAIENACMLYEGQKRIKTAVFIGLAYPVVLVALAFGFMAMFGIQVIPAFDQIVPRDRWTGVGASLAVMSDFVTTGLVPTLCTIAALVALMLWSMPRWTGKLRSKVDRIAPYSIYRLVAGSGFLLSVAALVKAGVKVTTVLSILARDANPWYAERVNSTLNLVNEGSNIGDALYRTGLNFPDAETVNDLRSYARLDKFDEMLMRLGRENLEDTVLKIQQQAVALKNVGIVMLGVVFAWIAIGLFDLQTQITAGM